MIKNLFLLLFLFVSTALGYNPSITSFNAGQVSPLMEARSDFQKYTASSRILENMLITTQGPVLKRPGTKYIATVKSGTPRLLPFEYSTDDAYVLETGNLYMRFCRDGGQILDPTNPVEIVTPFATDELDSIQYAQADNSMYFANGTDIPQVLSRTSHTAWTMEDVDFQTGPFLPENDTTTTITPSATTGSITLTASSGIFESTSGASHIGSIWQINQVGGNPQITGTFSANGVSIATAEFTGGYSFTTSGNSDGTITLQRSTNGGTSWRNALSPLTDTDFDNPAETEETGAIYRAVMSNYGGGTPPTYNITVADNTNKGVVKITAVASSTSATATVLNDLVSTSATAVWREGYWSDYRGWPKTVAFHQQRLVFGGSETYPQTIWFGKTDPADYANFFEGTLDTSAFTVALPGQNPTKWLLSQDYLLIGTSGSCGKYGDQGKAVTPTSPNYQEQSPYGSDSLRAVQSNSGVLYVERGARRIREFGYKLQSDKFESDNLNILSPEITDGGITDIAFQLRPNPILWCVLGNGDMATLTYNQAQSVVAWTKQVTDGDFKSVAVISGDDEDEVWTVVSRDVGTYIEQFQPMDWGSDQEDAWFVDCGLGYDSTAATTFAGLSHLEGETVSVFADGIVLSDETVASSQVTIDVSSSTVAIGLPYTAKLETLPIRADPQDYALKKKIKRIFVDFYKTGDVEFGNGAESDLVAVDFTDGASFTAYTEFHTSDYKLKSFVWPFGGMTKQTAYFESSKPVPLGIRAIIPQMEIRR